MCGMSGFVYYATALTSQNVPVGPSIIPFLELGHGQECFTCDTNDMGNIQCSRIDLPGQTDSNPYIWSLESCGK